MIDYYHEIAKYFAVFIDVQSWNFVYILNSNTVPESRVDLWLQCGI